ncbi:MAG: hypothetical protein LAP21_15790 [Acidobacteriia bacterium]|nr:hypothetical protein [Terriglobia bacterium]
MRFKTHSEKLAVCQLAAQSLIPQWAATGGFHSATVTPGEVSEVRARQALLQAGHEMVS